MTKRHRYGALPALLMAGLGWSVLTGCSETSIVGSVLDEQIRSGEFRTQVALTRGANSEVTDIWAVGFGGYWGMTDLATDAFIDTETSSNGPRIGTGQWNTSDMDTQWEQGMEGSWSGLKIVNNMIEFFAENPEAGDFETSVLVARGWLNSAEAERLIGELFCTVAYNFNQNGGQDLELLGDAEFDGGPVPQDSAFKRAVTFANEAIEQAERAIANGTPNPSTTGRFSDILFDPEHILTTAHATKAQAHWALAVLDVDPGTNWNLAVQHAAEVPTDFVNVNIHDENVEFNEWYNASWNNDNYTLFSRPDVDDEMPEDQDFVGVPATFQFGDDPRIEIQKCEENSSGCDNRFGEGQEGPTGNGFPLWLPLKYMDPGDDVVMQSGAEMRLIEAENALVNGGDFATFYDKIDEARSADGVDPLPAAERFMVMGDLEWPNAEDDAMSILDRERYLTLHLEGRRLFDLHRWEHPFITDNRALFPRHAAALQGSQRRSCAPIAQSECSLNQAVQNDPGCTF